MWNDDLYLLISLLNNIVAYNNISRFHISDIQT